jgi:hypothetical protein
MSNTPDSFEDFLAEISTSLTSETGEAALRRINTERLLKLILEDIVKQRHDLQIRILTDSGIAGQAGADILMQIDDYEIRLNLIDATPDKLHLTISDLEQLRSLFEENPSTEALVLTWTIEDLPSVQISLKDLDRLKADPDQIVTLLNGATPLAQVVNRILDSHIKVWETFQASFETTSRSTTDLRKLFEDHFKKVLTQERERSYRNEERKIAAENMPEERETDLITKVLDDALKGSKSETLAKQLARLSKGGRQ